ncbi:type IV pilus biogenesis/stability protein PilW [Pseudomonas sp. LRF_L74]|uniref:type IV pilus biogenesis/stability protein PilW n=1 Tax=Pseudomonas sp. LRF_L74 TaxID=3369422 RepID=UPI003F5F39FD
MIFRAVFLLLMAGMLGACVSTGGRVDPMKTQEGRDKARDAYIQLGLGFLSQGATEKAKEPLKSALAIDSSSAEAHGALAAVFQREMEPKLAEQHYRKALSNSDNDARLMNNYGGFLYEQKRYKEAYDVYLKATQDDMYSERSRVFENLGLTCIQLDRKAEAAQFFERALRLNARRPVALFQMAQMSYEKRDYVSARNFYRGYSQQGQQTPQSLLLGIRLAKVFDQRDEAASLGLQLKRLYPGTPEYQQYLSEQ